MLKKIRMFGLEYCDLPTILWNLSVLLRVLTLNINGRNKKGISIFCYILITVLSICYVYVYVFSVIWFVLVRTPQTGDMVPAMVVLGLMICGEIGTVKLLYMFFNIKKIQKLTEAFLVVDSEMSGSRLSVNVLKYMRTIKLRVILYWLMININGILYVLHPLVRSGRHFPEDNIIVYGLEPTFESPNYEIAFIISGAGVLMICFISANVTGYPMTIIGYIESLTLALNNEISYMWPDAVKYYETVAKTESYRGEINEYNKNKIINEHARKSLKYIIKQHATVKNLLSQVVEVSRGFLAIGLISLILGLIFEFLGGLENTIFQVPYTFMQIFIDCYIGQKVMDAGEIFQQAVYDCKWENLDVPNRKMVLIMLQVSQKTMAMSAAGVADLNFMFMMSAIKSVYSAYTALQSTMK